MNDLLQEDPKPTQDVFNGCPIPYQKREFLTDDDNDADKSSNKHTSSLQQTNAATIQHVVCMFDYI